MNRYTRTRNLQRRVNKRQWAIEALEDRRMLAVTIWDVNDHGYEVISKFGGITWDDARTDAVARGGTLATITSQEENDFIFSLVDDDTFWLQEFGPFIGGIQPGGSEEPDGGWSWVTGEIFNDESSNWRLGEPSNEGVGEDRIHFFGSDGGRSRMWNDTTSTVSLVAYVVEYPPAEDIVGDQISDALPLQVGQSVGHQAVDFPQDVDMYSFTVTANQRVGFDVDTFDSGLDSIVRLFSDDGTELANNDDGGNVGPVPEDSELDSYLEFTFTQAGTYFLGVSGFGNSAYDPVSGAGDASGSTGSYTLNLVNIPVEIVDTDDQISEAIPINLADTKSGEIDPGDDVDMYSFTAAANQRLGFDIDTFGSDLDSMILLFNVNGDLLASNDDGGNAGPQPEDFSRDSYLEFTLPEAGTYFLGVSGFSNFSYEPLSGGSDAIGSIGGYTLLLSEVGAVSADCNGDGLTNISDANCTPNAELDAFLAALSPASLRGDADGDGTVGFFDFVALSSNFGGPGQYTDGDYDKDGQIQFGDFIILSSSFGQSGAAAASVPGSTSTGVSRVTSISSDQASLGQQDARVMSSRIDLLYAALASGPGDLRFDLNQDDTVSPDDVQYLVEQVVKTRFGDADLNRRVDFADLATVASNYGHDGASWSLGDFDGDGQVLADDFDLLVANFGFGADQ